MKFPIYHYSQEPQSPEEESAGS